MLRAHELDGWLNHACHRADLRHGGNGGRITASWIQTDQAARQTDLLTQYRAVLKTEGVEAVEIDRRSRIIREQGRTLEVEM
jgi:hypothetical protein